MQGVDKWVGLCHIMATGWSTDFAQGHTLLSILQPSRSTPLQCCGMLNVSDHPWEKESTLLVKASPLARLKTVLPKGGTSSKDAKIETCLKSYRSRFKSHYAMLLTETHTSKKCLFTRATQGMEDCTLPRKLQLKCNESMARR